MKRLLARVDALAFPQRVALVLGIEAALLVLGRCAADYLAPGGWYGYPGVSAERYNQRATSYTLTAISWLVFIAIGTAIAVRLLHKRHE